MTDDEILIDAIIALLPQAPRCVLEFIFYFLIR